MEAIRPESFITVVLFAAKRWSCIIGIIVFFSQAYCNYCFYLINKGTYHDRVNIILHTNTKRYF